MPLYSPSSGGSTAVSRAVVLTSENTSSTTYTDLATAGPAVTITCGVSGVMLVATECQLSPPSGGNCAMAIAVSGGATIAADDDSAILSGAAPFAAGGNFSFTGTPGVSYTFTAKYRGHALGSSGFLRRYISAITV